MATVVPGGLRHRLRTKVLASERVHPACLMIEVVRFGVLDEPCPALRDGGKHTGYAPTGP